jgi:hypothetical protein
VYRLAALENYGDSTTVAKENEDESLEAEVEHTDLQQAFMPVHPPACPLFFLAPPLPLG